MCNKSSLHRSGILPIVSDVVNMEVKRRRGGGASSANSCSTFSDILSDLLDLLALGTFSRFVAPHWLLLMFPMAEWKLAPLVGMSSFSLLNINTVDLWVLPLPSDTRTLSEFKGSTSVPSLLLHLT